MFSDEVQGIFNYVRLQKATFERLNTAVPSDFNNGILSGLDMVADWIQRTCKCDTTAERKEKE